MGARRTALAAGIALLAQMAQAGGPALPGLAGPIPGEWLSAWNRLNPGPALYVNRLVLERSAYLRQHADNPIDWRPWNEEALAVARAQNKLVFLSIGYASCHWCHVMERESFEDVEVAEHLNSEFLSIKVDREQHPDVDHYYSQAAEAVMGESGWPLTAVLTPNGQPFLIYSYLPKADLLALLDRAAAIWRDRPEWVQRSANQVALQVERRITLVRDSRERFDPEWPRQAEQRLRERIDARFGLFGTAEKFPSQLQLHFLLDRYKVDRDEALARELTIQLDRIMLSGLSDAVFGGVFRYTTDRQMRQPHFEKMLYDQALAVSLYADAHAWLAHPEYLAFAQRIREFVERDLAGPNGLFAAATDAEHEGVEGGFYLWPESAAVSVPEGLAALPFPDGRTFIIAKHVEGLDPAATEKFRASRAGQPRRAENDITAWNAMWLQALIDLGDAGAAAELGESLWSQAWRDGVLYRIEGQPGYLDDYAYLASVFWSLHLATGDTGWKSKAIVLTEAIRLNFQAEGALYYQPAGAAAPARMEAYHDQLLPNPAALTIELFRRLETRGEARDLTTVLERRAFGQVGDTPEQYLTLIARGGAGIPTGGTVFARGHGLARLAAAEDRGAWRLELQLEPGWHVNASRVLDDYLIPTRVTGAREEIRITADYPEGRLEHTRFSEEPLLLYEGRLEIPLTAEPQGERLEVDLQVQACSQDLCLPPESLRLMTGRPNR